LRITDKEGVDVKGAKLGEELYLRIDMENDSIFDIFARDLKARSGSTDETIILIDSNGYVYFSLFFIILIQNITNHFIYCLYA
jgi:hypothetical protein